MSICIGPTNPTFRDLLMKPPEMNDAVHFMTEIAASWDEIGIALDVPPDYRDSLLREGYSSLFRSYVNLLMLFTTSHAFWVLTFLHFY